MATSESVLRRGIDRRDDATYLTLDRVFAGLPDTAHGGTLLAAFLLVARETPPRRVRGVYRRRVPLGVPLRLDTMSADGTHICRLLGADGAVLVDGTVADTVDEPSGAVVPPPAGPLRPLPVSSTCFACGRDNPLGLHMRLTFDEARVSGRWEPRDALRGPDGALAAVAVTTLLDEAAFWLGALATGESGMTTDLDVTLRAAPAFGQTIVVEGARASVRATADPRYLSTEVVARDERGALVATARITFVAVRGAARRLATGMLAMNEPDVIRAVFPAYVK